MLPVLFPLLFENGDRDFCLFAILTINFLNCIHVDEKDDLGPSVDRDLTEELQSLLHCPHLNESQKVEIRSSIAILASTFSSFVRDRIGVGANLGSTLR